jgi:hypothetical protein
VSEVLASVLEAIAFNAEGLVPAIAQQHDTGAVLMMAWMNRAAVSETLETGRVCYFSRYGARAKPPGRCSGWWSFGSIVTAILCCCWWIRPGSPATPVGRAVSTAPRARRGWWRLRRRRSRWMSFMASDMSDPSASGGSESLFDNIL